MPEVSKERDLLDAAVAGNSKAAEQLLMCYFSALERHLEPRIPPGARRHLGVDDVLQDVLTQAFRDIKHFQCRDGASFSAWLKAIADNRLADCLKAIGRKKRGGGQRRLSSMDDTRTSTLAALVDIVSQDSHLPDDSAQRQRIGRTAAAVRGLIQRGKVKLAEAMGRSSQWLTNR